MEYQVPSPLCCPQRCHLHTGLRSQRSSEQVSRHPAWARSRIRGGRTHRRRWPPRSRPTFVRCCSRNRASSGSSRCGMRLIARRSTPTTPAASTGLDWPPNDPLRTGDRPPLSRARLTRLKAFDQSWDAALARLDTPKLTAAARADLDALRRTIAANHARTRDRHGGDVGARARAAVRAAARCVD